MKLDRKRIEKYFNMILNALQKEDKISGKIKKVEPVNGIPRVIAISLLYDKVVWQRINPER